MVLVRMVSLVIFKTQVDPLLIWHLMRVPGVRHDLVLQHAKLHTPWSAIVVTCQNEWASTMTYYIQLVVHEDMLQAIGTKAYIHKNVT